MKFLIPLFAISFSLNSLAINIGDKVSNFSLLGEDGKNYSLSDFKGKTVVLEWLNHGCPFVRKHYDSGNMQKTQKLAASKNMIWLSINSSAEGKQGHVNTEGAKEEMQKYKSMALHTLLDHSGKVGKMFEAQTTPHMYIIDSQGVLVYQGAIDSVRSTDQDDIPSATNYVAKAINEISEGKAVSQAKTKAYGCSVKY